MLGFGEILLVAIALFLVFGASRLPKLGKSLGEGIREFKDSLKAGIAEDDTKEAGEGKTPPQA